MSTRLPAVLMILPLLAAGALARPGAGTSTYDLARAMEADLLYGRGGAAAKTDTVFLFGGPGTAEGRFQDPFNSFVPAWNGWTHVDNTQGEAVWQTTVDLSPTGTEAAWLGTLFPACVPSDPEYGYGNGWNTALVWEGEVADPALPVNLTVSYVLQHDTETGYDEITFEVERGGMWVVEDVYSGLSAGVLNETQTITLTPGELDGSTVRLRLHFISDSAFSDEDCLWPTAAGAFQLDDFAVSGDNGIVATLDDFTGGVEAGALRIELTGGRGDFAKVWPMLADIDVCFENFTPAVAFIDDGIVEPCTGGTMGTTWLYGPGGYCVNVTGGCGVLHQGVGIDNMIISPPIALDGGDRGLLLEYDAFLHLPFENGVFHYVRSRTSDDGGASWGFWSEDVFLIFREEGAWVRRAERLDHLVPPGATHMQVALGVVNIDFGFGSDPDPTPAPYLDNVALRSFPVIGPAITTRESNLAQDAFPAGGVLDPVDLGANDVPVDTANDVDQIQVSVASTRPGAVLTGPPVLHYVLRANPLYDPYRAHPVSGSVTGDTLRVGDLVVAGDWSFDLPDTDFLYPGDIMHYYFEASDSDGVTVETATLPQDLTSYGVFPAGSGASVAPYDTRFTMYALPQNVNGTQLLIWDDGLEADDLEDLGRDLQAMCAGFGVQGVDLYRTQEPGLGLENGLGGGATAAQLAVYDAVLYLSGRRESTLRYEDRVRLGEYLDQGGLLFAFSENMAEDLDGSSQSDAHTFLSQRLGVAYSDQFLPDLLNGEYSPVMVDAAPQNVFGGTSLVHYGGCPNVTDADVVSLLTGTLPVLAWTDPAGNPVDGLDAGTLRVNGAGGAAFLFPWPLDRCYFNPQDLPPQYHPSVTDFVLNRLLSWAGLTGLGCAGAIEDEEAPLAFAADAHPNPFNPEVVLSFTAPRDARAVVEVFDVRGAKVRTLQDGPVSAGTHHRTWDGRDDGGRVMASGVYFARIRVGERQAVEKLALVR